MNFTSGTASIELTRENGTVRMDTEREVWGLTLGDRTPVVRIERATTRWPEDADVRSAGALQFLCYRYSVPYVGTMAEVFDRLTAAAASDPHR